MRPRERRRRPRQRAPDAGAILSIAIEPVDLVAREPGVAARERGPTLALLRLGDTPLGRALLQPAAPGAAGVTLGSAITAEHADRALRAAVLAWYHTQSSESFQVDSALDYVRRAPATRDSDDPAVTVAICTRDRPARLQRALGAVRPLLGARDEVLVVLNAPAAGQAVRDPVDPRIRFVVEPRPGLDWARNRALLEFRSDIILFVDDDCVPEPGWVRAMRSLFRRNPDVDLATGAVEPLELETPAQLLFERYRGFPHASLRRWTHVHRETIIARSIGTLGQLGAGANFAVSRQLIDRVGPFDAALGAGTVTGGGDELEYFFRALKSGGVLAYEPRAVVRHDHRCDLAALEGQLERWSAGMSCAMERSSLAFPVERQAFRALRIRIALLHHLRRAVMHPPIRRLALAELRGLRGASARYARARREAKQIASRIASDAPDCAPHESGALVWSDPSARSRAAVAASDPRYLALQLDDVGEVTVLRSRGRPGAAALPARPLYMGADRFADTIIVEGFGGTIVGGNWHDAVTRVQRQLAEAARSQR